MGSTVLRIARLADSPGLGADGANTFPETQKNKKNKKNAQKPKVLQHISNYGFIFYDFSGSENPKNPKKQCQNIDFYSILAVLSKCVPSARLATTYHQKH